eukprot:TRINITY_DN14044_c0_g1_i1.p1 TRINITY_DN14044_c0_g1~~TRINITY_DN14044_c0_g1_i1.p1  ORF type:complete len:117 (+),score=12.77 TRINITY_DN14044_c0_g1_i1:278-628(+)
MKDISDQTIFRSALRFQILPLLQNKQLSCLTLKSRLGDNFLLTDDFIDKLCQLRLSKLKLYGLAHGGHAPFFDDYDSEDDYNYQAEHHLCDVRTDEVPFDSEPSDFEAPPVENQEP